MKKIFTRDYFNKKKKEQSKRNADYINSIRKLGCSKCTEKDLSCIDFHHKIPSKKKYKIIEMAYKGYSIKSIQDEIDKCDRLCCNCHRKHHHKLGVNITC